MKRSRADSLQAEIGEKRAAVRRHRGRRSPSRSARTGRCRARRRRRARRARRRTAAPPRRASATLTSTSSGSRLSRPKPDSARSSAADELDAAQRRLRLERVPAALEQLGLLLLALLLAQALEALLDDGEVGEHQLALEAADVARRVGARPASTDRRSRARPAPARRRRASAPASSGRARRRARAPGKSTNTISAYVVLRGEKISLSRSMRASGTLMAPRFGLPGSP